MPTPTRRALVPILALTLAACGGDFGGAGGGGATPGGVKDLGLARELIAAGTIPPPEALLVEGMFAEHDLPLDGPPCTEALCGRLGLGLAPDESGARTAWLQVGLASAISPGTWQRPPTTFIMTVDVSGSMGWIEGGDDDQATTPGALARRLLQALGDELTPLDRVAIVTYGSSVSVPLPLTRGDDPRYQGAVAALTTAGSTNMEAGLERAYGLAAVARAAGDTAQVRVILFTDALPNVGATEPGQFERLARAAGDDGTGLTLFALGLGLGADVTKAMSVVRGANAFTFFDHEDIGEFFADEWPECTTPIAYDLVLDVALPEGAELTGAYGFPQGAGARPGLSVASVFLSRRRGALLLALRPPSETFTAGMTLAYTTAGGERRTVPLAAAYRGEALDARGQYFDQPSTASATALALLVAGMRRAATQYAADPAAAEATMRATHERFAADAAALADASLARELTLSSALLALFEARATQAL